MKLFQNCVGRFAESASSPANCKEEKPVILSTGASDVWEIATAINELSRHGCDQVILLHCVLNYPTPIGSAHLGMIKGLQASFPNHLVGYSDHTLPDENMVSLATAFALGSCVIEKHFTSDKSLPGNDHYHAMDVNDLKTFMGIAKKMHSLCRGTRRQKGHWILNEMRDKTLGEALSRLRA